jgi:small subunit ribosomal protein S16
LVRIRLRRIGTRNKPFFRVVVADSRSPRDGANIEEIGYYNPQRPEEFRLDVERADYWISKGAQPSNRVLSLLRRAKKEVGEADISVENGVEDVKPAKGGSTDERTD